MTTGKEVYETLRNTDPGAAETWATLRTAMVEAADGFAPDGPTTGALVGHLDKALSSLRGAMIQRGYADPDPRHLFLALLTGHESSKMLSDAQVDWMLGELSEAVGDRWELREQTAEHWRAMVLAAITAAIAPPIEFETQVTAQVQVPHTQEESKAMVTQAANVSQGDLPHLKTVSVTYERKLNLGDYNSATIGVQYWADISDDVDPDVALDAMWEHAKAQLKAQALPLVQKSPAPNPGHGASQGPPPDDAWAASAPAPAPVPPAPTRTVAHPAGAQVAPPPPPAQGNGNTPGGTAKLLQLTVQPGGKVEFTCEGMRYPLKDSRGAGIVSQLFDASTGITEAHLTTPVIYTSDQLGTMFVDWAQPGKYRDVIRVHR